MTDTVPVTSDHEPGWLIDLEPLVEQLLGRHLRTAREWFPHQYVPWGQGRDFDGPLDGIPWQEAHSALSPTARSVLMLSILTEDNLPSYFQSLGSIGQAPAWREWAHRWAAEEDRHATVMRAYAHATRALDPVVLERLRMQHMATVAPERPTQEEGLAYVMVQELATRVAHRATAANCGEPVCERLFTRVAQDENLHMLFYRDLFRALLDFRPEAAMNALSRTVRHFAMPARNLPEVARLSNEVAAAGWYDLKTYRDDVLKPLLRSLGVMDRPNLNSSAEQARERIASMMTFLDRTVRRMEDRRAAVDEARPDSRTPAV